MDIDLRTLSLAFLAMISVGGVAYVFLYPYLSGDIRAQKRQEQLSAGNPAERARERVVQVNRRDQVASTLKELEAREKGRRNVDLQGRIVQAGLTMSRNAFLLMSAGIGAGLGLITLVGTGKPLLALGMLFAGAFGVPTWGLSFLRKRRIDKFVNEFPNAMDVIVRGIKAGLPLGDCLRVIANESAEPVRSEFRYIVETQQLGVPLPEAVSKLFERVPVSESNFFGIVVTIQQKSGGNLSEALGNLSRVLRERKKMKGKVKAMSMEAKASAAIIASLPVAVCFMLSLSSPDYIKLLYTTQAGQLWLAASGFWMFIGVMVMRKMINFDL
jgi:tight adherence protein B